MLVVNVLWNERCEFWIFLPFINRHYIYFKFLLAEDNPLHFLHDFSLNEKSDHRDFQSFQISAWAFARNYNRKTLKFEVDLKSNTFWGSFFIQILLIFEVFLYELLYFLDFFRGLIYLFLGKSSSKPARILRILLDFLCFSVDFGGFWDFCDPGLENFDWRNFDNFLILLQLTRLRFQNLRGYFRRFVD